MCKQQSERLPFAKGIFVTDSEGKGFCYFVTRFSFEHFGGKLINKIACAE